MTRSANSHRQTPGRVLAPKPGRARDPKTQQLNRGLRAQEPPPRGAVTALRCRWYAHSVEDPPDRRRTHVVAQAA